MLKLERLTLAMAEFEGWNTSIENKNGIGSISWRNNNPGNLRSSPFGYGIKDGFVVFNTEAAGWAAFRWDIIQKANGNTSTGLNGQSTLRDLIFKWAPASDNNYPENYLKAVVKMTGIDENTTLAEIIK